MNHPCTLFFPILLAASANAVEPLHKFAYQTFHRLDAVSEASGIMFKPDTGTLVAVGDEGHAVVELSKSGVPISSMAFDQTGPREGRALDDPEGLAYLGDGRFVIADERRNLAVVSTYVPGATRTLAELAPTSCSFGPYEGNTGLEGVAYDPINGSYWGVREIAPIKIYQMSDPGGSGQVVAEPLEMRFINRLNIAQLSDIYVLAASAAFPPGSPRRQNILILSRDAALIVEVDRAGKVIDTLDISFIARNTIEGITMDDEGVIYLVSEGIANHLDPYQQGSALHVLGTTPPPAPLPFVITACAVAGGEEGMGALLTWNSIVGKNYVIEFSGTLREEDWQAVSPVLTAAAASMTAPAEAPEGAANGFFRVAEAP